MNFDRLVSAIQDTHTTFQQRAAKAINKHLTIRNWLIGFYMVEFEQKGEDRAEYGQQLLPKLALSLAEKGISNTNERELRRYRTFYGAYPSLGGVFVDDPIRSVLPLALSDQRIRGTLSPESNTLHLSPEKILNQLSFSHLAELLEMEDSLKRILMVIEKNEPLVEYSTP